MNIVDELKAKREQVGMQAHEDWDTLCDYAHILAADKEPVVGETAPYSPADKTAFAKDGQPKQINDTLRKDKMTLVWGCSKLGTQMYVLSGSATEGIKANFFYDNEGHGLSTLANQQVDWLSAKMNYCDKNWLITVDLSGVDKDFRKELRESFDYDSFGMDDLITEDVAHAEKILSNFGEVVEACEIPDPEKFVAEYRESLCTALQNSSTQTSEWTAVSDVVDIPAAYIVASGINDAVASQMTEIAKDYQQETEKSR